MKICFIITGLGGGGAEEMLFKLVRSISRSQFELCIISLTTLGKYGPRFVSMGVPVYTLEMRGGSFPSPKIVFSLVKLIRAVSPDLVSTWMYHADLLGGIAARMAGIKAVAWNVRHSDLSLANNKPLTLLVVKICALLSRKIPDKILTCSEKARSVHVRSGYCGEKMVVLPNGFDLERFAPRACARSSVRAELGLGDDVPLVGLIARNDPSKNHLGFIEAACQVQKAIPKANFLMAGTGIDCKNVGIATAIERTNSSQIFHLLGQRDDVPRLMAALDVLASTSSGEAFPNVLGEAMACAIPCVVTDAGDSADIVGDAGHVVAVGDMNRLAAHIVEVLLMSQSDRIALGKRARERVRRLYEIQHVVTRYEAFYSSLAEAGTA